MIFPELIQAGVAGRENRFVVSARDREGRMVRLHLANSGRLRELIVPGRELWYQPVDVSGGQKTAGKLLLVREEGGGLVCIDATLPNRVVEEALRRGELEPFSAYPAVRREYAVGRSRFDFFLSGPAGECLLEVKSVTLVERGVAMFPDAPTERGLKHLEELGTLQGGSLQTAVLFLIQRADAGSFTPNDRTQPEFRRKLREIRERGTWILAYDCDVTEREIRLRQPVEIVL